MQRLRTQKIVPVVFIGGWALYLAAFAQVQSDVQSKPSTTRAASAHIDFGRDIRPILSDKCFVCHGPDAANNKSKLRFDTEAHAFADLGYGRHAIVRGDPVIAHWSNASLPIIDLYLCRRRIPDSS